MKASTSILTSAVFLLVSNRAISQTKPPSDMLEKAIQGTCAIYIYQTTETAKVFGFADVDRTYSGEAEAGSWMSAGSGFFINQLGKNYIITNYHVVAQASEEGGSIFMITSDQRKIELRVKGADTFYDLAVLEPTNAVTLNTVLKFESREPRVGEPCYALGNPLGDFPFSVTQGIVSGKNRGSWDNSGKRGYIQSSATISGGNSGGALVNADGNVIGINTWGEVPDGSNANSQLNFALESSTASRVAKEIIETGRVSRAYFGLHVIETEQVIYSDGGDVLGTFQIDSKPPVVAKVMNGSPFSKEFANKSGYQITTINGAKVNNFNDFVNHYEKIKPGSTTIFILRKEKEVDTVVAKNVPAITDQDYEQMARSMFTRNNMGLKESGGKIYIRLPSEQILQARKDAQYGSDKRLRKLLKPEVLSKTEEVELYAVAGNGFDFRISGFRDLGIVSRIAAMDGQLYVGYYDPVTGDVFTAAVLLNNQYGQYERTFMF